MDRKDIERLRVPGFSDARRGYDRREVDRFLGQLADWLETDAPAELGTMAVKHKLELVGKSTAHILVTAEQEAEQMRRRTEDECADLRSEAETASLGTRRAADEYAKKVRERADQDARRTAEAASAKAKGTIEEGERRRAQIEALVSELYARRDGTLRELERLQGELASTIGEHRSGARPDERKGGEGRERAPGAKEPDTVSKLQA
jgi:DivIVA domain-containing protein